MLKKLMLTRIDNIELQMFIGQLQPWLSIGIFPSPGAPPPRPHHLVETSHPSNMIFCPPFLLFLMHPSQFHAPHMSPNLTTISPYFQ